MIHTKEGGQKTILLKIGKAINLEMPATSTWLIDASNGSVILPVSKNQTI